MRNKNKRKGHGRTHTQPVREDGHGARRLKPAQKCLAGTGKAAELGNGNVTREQNRSFNFSACVFAVNFL